MAPRLDTLADTLLRNVEQFFRVLSPELTMTKWPGYIADGGRTRFQRRIPEDVRHAFNGALWVRRPLGLPPGREAQRSATSWYLAYDEEFSRIRNQATSGLLVAPHPASTSRALSDYTPEEMRSLMQPAADTANRSQHDAIATGAQSFEQLTSRQSDRELDSGLGVAHGRGNAQGIHQLVRKRRWRRLRALRAAVCDSGPAPATGHHAQRRERHNLDQGEGERRKQMRALTMRRAARCRD